MGDREKIREKDHIQALAHARKACEGLFSVMHSTAYIRVMTLYRISEADNFPQPGSGSLESLVPSLTRCSIDVICHFCLGLLWLFSSLSLNHLATFIGDHLNRNDLSALVLHVTYCLLMKLFNQISHDSPDVRRRHSMTASLKCNRFGLDLLHRNSSKSHLSHATIPFDEN